MARNFRHIDVSNANFPPEIPKGTPVRCEMCEDYLDYKDRLNGLSVCPRCSEALSEVSFCDCDEPHYKRMVIPDCGPDEPFNRCEKCGRLV